MYPEFISYGHLQSYTVLVLAGYLCAWLLARRRARKGGPDVRHVDNILLLLLLVVPVGARLFSRLFYMPSVRGLDVLKLWEGGGLVFYGGMLFGVGSVLVYAIWQRLHILKLTDTLAPSLAIGLAMGRVGCLLGGCCWGDVCVGKESLAQLRTPSVLSQIHTAPWLSSPNFPFKVTYPPGSDPYRAHEKLGLISLGAPRSAPVHPVQIYEAILTFMLAGALLRTTWPNVVPGTLLCGWLLGYAGIRFGTEFFRADNEPIYLGMTLSQAISLILASVAAFVIVRLQRTINAPQLVRTTRRDLSSSPSQPIVSSHSHSRM